MNEAKNQTEQSQTKVELQIIPCVKSITEAKTAEVMNHESQDDCVGKIILTVTCDGSKLTKADAGKVTEQHQDIWVTAKVSANEISNIPNIDVSIHEQNGAKLTKCDAGKI